jgi:hypothetical protein
MDDNKDTEAEKGRSFKEGNQPEFLRGETIADRSGRSQRHSDYTKGDRFEVHFHRAESTTR